MPDPEPASNPRGSNGRCRTTALTHIARLTANLLRPVLVGDLVVEVMTDDVGRNAGHFSAHLMAQSLAVLSGQH